MTEERKRAASGEYTPEYDDEDILALLPHDEPVTIPELLNDSDIPRSTLNYHLNRLADEGRVEKRKPSANIVLWSRAE